MQSNLLFQYCQKLVVLSADKKSVLLAKRKREADYDGIFSFIGGKMETTDIDLVAGMKREKNEEISTNTLVKILPYETHNVFFCKKDGNSMVLPHIPGVFVSGEITINDEYSEYKWVPIVELDNFEPKIEGIFEITNWALQKVNIANDSQFVEI
jgi:8-oxo-dGTP pyrophosphatase MutT (NUDIX family)